ncbi:hypothetical protein FMM74_021340 [Lachnospiraceae bacterium MD308]|nr:hypothetical protein [Lachnospiraceae bacterium MD308]
MIILLTIIFLFLFLWTMDKCYNDNLTAFYGIAFGVGLIFILVLSWRIINGHTLESKINMYAEENQKIEENINVLVEQYMNYEANTYGDLNNESSITLVSLYPELKADTLVENRLRFIQKITQKSKI